MSTAQVESPSAHTPSPNGKVHGCRDAKGRFAAGNPGGPGNPYAREVAALKRGFVKFLSEEKMTILAEKLFVLACNGNMVAAKLLLQYSLGKPSRAIDPDHLDIEEWQHFRETSGMARDLPKLALAPGPDFTLSMLRELRPGATQMAMSSLGDMLTNADAIYAAQDAQREGQRAQQVREIERRNEKYQGVVPDATGLPPEVSPLRPKANGRNGGKTPPAKPSAVAAPGSVDEAAVERELLTKAFGADFFDNLERLGQKESMGEVAAALEAVSKDGPPSPTGSNGASGQRIEPALSEGRS